MRLFLISLMSILLVGTAFAADQGTEYQTLSWDDLMPKGEWENYDRLFQSLFEAGNVAEGGPQDRMIQLGTFKTVPELDGKKVRMPGLVLPFEFNSENLITEFLLVPYFGACIHAPPPPPNQIVYVKSELGIVVERLWMPVWASGTLHTTKKENELGDAAYTLTLDWAEPFEE